MKQVIILVLLLFAFNFSYGQRGPNSNVFQPGFSVGVSGGGMFPIAKFSDEAEPGGGGNFSMVYNCTPHWSAFSDITYNALPNPGSTTFYVTGVVGSRYNFPLAPIKSSVFIEAGAGAYNFRVDQDSATSGLTFPDVSQIQAGVNLGIGGNLYMNELMDFFFKTNIHQTLFRNERSMVTAFGGFKFKF